jgi:thioredoxin reductase (NADPH)
MYDVIIIGGGPAGLSAAIYCGRYKLKTLVLTKVLGGAITGAPVVENYPGYASISGIQLTENMQRQAEHVGASIELEEAEQVRKTKEGFLVNNKYQSRSIVLALGTERRKLNIPGEAKFEGKGISYCATCDAAFFQDKIVGVVGGRDAALMSAELLTRYAKKVYIMYRRDKLAGQPFTIDRVTGMPKVEVLYNTIVKELKGAKFLEGAIIEQNGRGKELKVDGLFVEIGSTPCVAMARVLGVSLDEKGYIVVDQNMRTNVHGVYAAGDITTASRNWRQVITACAEGALAAHALYSELVSKPDETGD